MLCKEQKKVNINLDKCKTKNYKIIKIIKKKKKYKI